jgi:hypothetical protein
MNVTVTDVYAALAPILRRVFRQRDREAGDPPEELAVKIKAFHKENRYVYGSSRVHHALLAQGHSVREQRCNADETAQDQGQHQEEVCAKTADSEHDQPVANNLLNCNLAASSLNAHRFFFITDKRLRWRCANERMCRICGLALNPAHGGRRGRGDAVERGWFRRPRWSRRHRGSIRKRVLGVVILPDWNMGSIREGRKVRLLLTWVSRVGGTYLL